MSKAKFKRTLEDNIVDSIVYFILLIIFITSFYPFYLSIILSFNDGLDSTKGGIYLLPRVLTLNNYKLFFTNVNWINAFVLTIFRTLLGTSVTVFVTLLVAYGLSYKNLMFKKFYITLIIISMYFSGGLIPYYITLKSVGLLNSFWVYIIPGALNLFFVLVAMSFFKDISPEMSESAMLDGASEITILIKIIMPISKPIMATLAIFSGVGHWNSWFDSAFFVRDESLRTLGYRLMEVINKSNIPSNAGTATKNMASLAATNPLATQVTAMVISVLPIMFIYPFLQKYFMSGLTLGSVKG